MYPYGREACFPGPSVTEELNGGRHRARQPGCDAALLAGQASKGSGACFHPRSAAQSTAFPRATLEEARLFYVLPILQTGRGSFTSMEPKPWPCFWPYARLRRAHSRPTTLAHRAQSYRVPRRAAPRGPCNQSQRTCPMGGRGNAHPDPRANRRRALTAFWPMGSPRSRRKWLLLLRARLPCLPPPCRLSRSRPAGRSGLAPGGLGENDGPQTGGGQAKQPFFPRSLRSQTAEAQSCRCKLCRFQNSVLLFESTWPPPNRPPPRPGAVIVWSLLKLDSLHAA